MMNYMHEDLRTGLFSAMLGDGRPFIALTGVALCASGGFAILQSWSGHLLPHDSQALGMDAEGISRVANHYLTMFMFHDRVAFGGTLLAIGTAYWWLSEFPLKAGQAWAWWTLAISGTAGFASFLTYLGYGYLDSWHALATLLLLPVFLLGLVRARACVRGRLEFKQIWHVEQRSEPRRVVMGRRMILACSVGLILAGATIMVVGMTSVFVPQDLSFIDLTRTQIASISPMMIPLIAHDRAGFGGGLFSCGLLIFFMIRHATLSRSFLEVVGLMGVFGFGAALGVHAAIGYVDVVHLAPAYLGSLLFLVGMICLKRKSNA
jgi:hypothetical protein